MLLNVPAVDRSADAGDDRPARVANDEREGIAAASRLAAVRGLHLEGVAGTAVPSPDAGERNAIGIGLTATSGCERRIVGEDHVRHGGGLEAVGRPAMIAAVIAVVASVEPAVTFVVIVRAALAGIVGPVFEAAVIRSTQLAHAEDEMVMPVRLVQVAEPVHRAISTDQCEVHRNAALVA